MKPAVSTFPSSAKGASPLWKPQSGLCPDNPLKGFHPLRIPFGTAQHVPYQQGSRREYGRAATRGPATFIQRRRLPKRLDIPNAGERSWGGALPAPPTLLWRSPREGSTQAKQECALGSGGHTSIVAPGRLLVLFAETKRTPLHTRTATKNPTNKKRSAPLPGRS